MPSKPKQRPLTPRQQTVLDFYLAVTPLDHDESMALKARIRRGLSSHDADLIIRDLFRRYYWMMEGSES